MAATRSRAFLGPTPSTNMSTRCQLTASWGFTTTRKCANRSFTCAASMNLIPPRFTNGNPQRDTFLPQFQDFLRHETRLRMFPDRLHQRRQRPVQLAREQMFRIFLRRLLNDFVGHTENRLCAPIIFFKLVDRGAGKPGREFHDVAERRAPEGIDGL